MKKNPLFRFKTSLLCSFGGILLAASIGFIVYAASQGPNNPSANDEILYGTEGWSNKSDIYTSNDAYAEAKVEDGEYTKYLVAKGFGFTIPAGDVIDGIEVTMERKGTTGNIKDKSIRLVKGASVVGDDKASAAAWPAADVSVTYGTPSDLWGTTWTPAEINDPDFGVAISAEKFGGSGEKTAYVDHVVIKVTYSTPLPVTFTSFNASLKETKVELQWTTASETNNDYFGVERSQNGSTFLQIAKVKGSGTTSVPHTYTFVDDAPLTGTSYYRLKQTDYDGKFEYSDMIAIYYEKSFSSECIFRVYPNPCMGRCNIKLENCPKHKDQQITVALVDALGNMVYSQVPVRDETGSFAFSIDVNNNLKPGVYIVRATSETEKYQEKTVLSN
jgi:hypothetical protein